ncbi:MAG: hypothetical protein N2037_10190 [Acidimicrobiales bacterium]|nr:hypothetical protein [Acidimicrobiales bacterium]
MRALRGAVRPGGVEVALPALRMEGVVLRRRARDPRALIVAAMCVWELAGLAGLVPTITAVWHRMREHKVGRLLLWMFAGWVIEHLWAEGR